MRTLICIACLATLLGCQKKRTDPVPEVGSREGLTNIPSAETTAAAPGNWSYSESEDDMGRGTTRTASVVSANMVTFSSPYDEMQHATLVIRKHPEYGRDIYMYLKSAQFSFRYDSKRVLVRFDDEKPSHYGVSEPADYSTDMIFITGFNRFVKKALKAKKLAIEAPFYQDGTRVFEFNIEGLDWKL